MSDEDDKTVFGQKLPPPQPRRAPPQQPPPQPQAPPPQAQPPQAPPPQQPQARPPAAPPQQGGGDRTVFGSALPSRAGGRVAPTAPQAPPPQAPAAAPPPHAPTPQAPPQAAPPTGMTWLGEMPTPPQPQQPTQHPFGNQQPHQYPPQQPPAGGPPREDTWLGGALNPQGYAPTGQPQAPPTNEYGQPARQPQYTPQGYAPTADDMFPEIPKAPEEQPQVRQTPRIALADALKGTGLGAGGSSNPIIAAAANLLILLGRLRSGAVEMQDGPLIDHVAREVELFEKNAIETGVPPADVADAKYALSATADDIVQNLPGADKGVWLQYSMVARFFGERSSGVGFFQKMDAAMKAPAQKFDLLEMMLTCLSLGFMGQYRTAPNGSSDLGRIRTAIYESLRRVKTRPDDDVSIRWTPVAAGKRRRFGGIPVWIIASIAGALVVGTFAVLSTLLSGRGGDAQQSVLTLHNGLPDLAIERSSFLETPRVAFEAPDTDQTERLRTALADRIANGDVVVEEKGDYVMVRVGAALNFASGSAELQDDSFTSLAGEIARAIEVELEALGLTTSSIRVVGHTDSIPPSGRGRYKTNEALSLARAETAATILQAQLSGQENVSIEGVGPADPIADNGTREGRAENRRVEIMIPRTGTQ